MTLEDIGPPSGITPSTAEVTAVSRLLVAHRDGDHAAQRRWEQRLLWGFGALERERRADHGMRSRT